MLSLWESPLVGDLVKPVSAIFVALLRCANRWL